MAYSTHTTNGALGRWTLTYGRPGHLDPVVDRLWHFRGQTACPRERVMPNGLLELVVHLGPRYGIVRGGRVERCAAVGISGLQTLPMLVQSPGAPGAVLGVQLTPGGAYALLGRPLHELTGLDVDLEDVIGSAADELRERCQRADNAVDCLDAAAGWMVQRLASATPVEPAVDWVAARIRRHRGRVSIGELRAQTGLSKTRLAARFREQIGVTPKLYARIHRFLHTITRLRSPQEPLSELALAAGYCDQPHLNAEFKELSGLTPGEFMAAAHYQTGVNVGET